ncbi:hypothetical protein ABZ858_12085 [Streptomyces sp. NPDC047017]|uniref:hypothetical protein n=1 Tax=Streptomyces sp. NPDC047017 TaxID=3155024 RepID=UPI0033EF81AC
MTDVLRILRECGGTPLTAPRPPEERFGVVGLEWGKGLWLVAGDVLRDLAALNGVELLPWTTGARRSSATRTSPRRASPCSTRSPPPAPTRSGGGCTGGRPASPCRG